MLNFYRSLAAKEKALVWVALAALIILTASLSVSSMGIVAVAQIAAAVGTLTIAGLAFAQVREMREARIAQEAPQVIVDADYSEPPFVFVVVRNIGRGAAKDITFEFSAPIEAPEGRDNPYWIPLNEQGYFAQGMDYLAPGAEIRNFWGSMITLGDFLRKQELEDGITIKSKYKSIVGRRYENQWTVNPLLVADRLSTSEVGMKDLVKTVQNLQRDLHRVINPINKELRVSTESERQERQRQKEESQD